MSDPQGTQRLFTRSDAWVGGYYEIEVHLRGRTQLSLAMVALWQFPDLRGCYLDRDREPALQDWVDSAAIGHNERTYGVATLRPLGEVACLSYTCLFDDGDALLSLCLPLGSLGAILPVEGFPFDRGPDRRWRDGVDQWLVSLGRHVFRRVEFDLAVIGYEVSEPYTTTHPDVSAAADRRCDSFLVRQGEDLVLLPRTEAEW
jgi:hypothetical protein